MISYREFVKRAADNGGTYGEFRGFKQPQHSLIGGPSPWFVDKFNKTRFGSMLSGPSQGAFLRQYKPAAGPQKQPPQQKYTFSDIGRFAVPFVPEINQQIGTLMKPVAIGFGRAAKELNNIRQKYSPQPKKPLLGDPRIGPKPPLVNLYGAGTR